MSGGAVGRGLASVRTYGWYPPIGRAPMLLWRAGFGPLMGIVFSIVSIRGRKTGNVHHNLVTHRSAGGRTFLLGFYGRGSHWYRNLQADPRITLQTALSTRSVRADALADEAEYADAYRLLRRSLIFRYWLWSHGIANDEADFVAKRDRTVLIELRPTLDVTPDPVRVDLLWVWPALAAAWVAWRRLRS